MSPPARLALFSPALAVALSVRLLRAFQAFFGGLEGVELDDPAAVAQALFARELPDALALALEEIERFATPLGREALLEAARGRFDVPPPWLDDPPVDLAARLVLRARGSQAEASVTRAILRRARVRVGRYFSPNASYEVVSPRAVTEEALRAAAREVHGPGLSRAWTVDREGILHAAFLHEGPAERIVRVEDGAFVKRTSRPVACDRVRWDPARMRLGFRLARPSLLPAWIAGVGRACGGDPATLSARPAFTLRPPHERGPGWFDPRSLPAIFRHVSVVGCELDDGSRYGVRSPSALGDLHDRLDAKGGYLVRVTLRFELAAGGTTDATIELPRKLTVAESRFERAIRQALDVLLLTAPGALADDLASLAPFEHAAWRWIEVVTAALFHDGAASGLFTQSTAARRATDAAHRPYGSSLMVHALDGEDTQYALGEDLSVHAYDVPAGTAVRWKLDTARLAASLAARMHLDRLALKSAPPPGLLLLGGLPLGATTARVFLLMRVVREGEAGDLRERLRIACGTAPAAVLVGRGRTLGEGTAQVEVETPRLFAPGELPDVVAAIAGALGAEEELDGWRHGSEKAPLVLLAARGQAWFGKVRLLVTANQLAMLLGLARTPGEAVGTTDLGKRISPNAGQLDVVVRKARQGWEQRIAESFEQAGVAMPEDLPGRLIEVDKARGSYRLGVGVVVRE